MRDMLDGEQPYPLTAWAAQFQRLRPTWTTRYGAKSRWRREAARRSSADSWPTRSPSSGPPSIRCLRWRGRAGCRGTRADPRLAAGASGGAQSAVARLLVENNETEEQTAQRVGEIYARSASGVLVPDRDTCRHRADERCT